MISSKIQATSSGLNCSSWSSSACASPSGIIGEIINDRQCTSLITKSSLNRFITAISIGFFTCPAKLHFQFTPIPKYGSQVKITNRCTYSLITLFEAMACIWSKDACEKSVYISVYRCAKQRIVNRYASRHVPINEARSGVLSSSQIISTISNGSVGRMQAVVFLACPGFVVVEHWRGIVFRTAIFIDQLRE